MKNIIRAVRVGEQVENATEIKWAQAAVVAIYVAYSLARTMGVDIPFDDDQLFAAITALSGVFQVWATLATSRKVGVLPRPNLATNDDSPRSPVERGLVPDKYVPSGGDEDLPSNPFLNDNN